MQKAAAQGHSPGESILSTPRQQEQNESPLFEHVTSKYESMYGQKQAPLHSRKNHPQTRNMGQQQFYAQEPQGQQQDSGRGQEQDEEQKNRVEEAEGELNRESLHQDPQFEQTQHHPEHEEDQGGLNYSNEFEADAQQKGQEPVRLGQQDRAQNKQKAEKRSNPTLKAIKHTLQKNKESVQNFGWGEEENESDARKKTYSHLFINNPDILYDLAGVKPSVEKPHYKIKAASNEGQQVDIWQDLRNKKTQPKKGKEAKGKRHSEKSIKNYVAEQEARLQQQNSKRRRKSVKNQHEDMGPSINNIDFMSKAISEKVKLWRKEQKQIESKRLNKIAYEQQRIKQMERRAKQDVENKRNEEKLQRLKAIEEKRKVRERAVSTSPLAKGNRKGKQASSQKQKKNQTQANQHDQRQNLALKKHRKNYHSEDRLQNSKVLNPSSIILPSIKKEFSALISKNVYEYDLQKSKNLRRKVYEQKVLEGIPLNSKQKRKLEQSINKDKLQNPKKYKLLGQKGMSDYQIYQNQRVINDMQEKNRLKLERSDVKPKGSPGKKIQQSPSARDPKGSPKQDNLDIVNRYVSQKIAQGKLIGKNEIIPAGSNLKEEAARIMQSKPNSNSKKSPISDDDKFLKALKK